MYDPDADPKATEKQDPDPDTDPNKSFRIHNTVHIFPISRMIMNYGTAGECIHWLDIITYQFLGFVSRIFLFCETWLLVERFDPFY